MDLKGLPLKTTFLLSFENEYVERLRLKFPPSLRFGGRGRLRLRLRFRIGLA